MAVGFDCVSLVGRKRNKKNLLCGNYLVNAVGANFDVSAQPPSGGCDNVVSKRSRT